MGRGALFQIIFFSINISLKSAQHTHISALVLQLRVEIIGGLRIRLPGRAIIIGL